MVPPAGRTCAPPLTTRRHTVAEACGESDITIVLEKLEGSALRCHVAPTVSETIQFQLADSYRATVHSMVVWLSNSSHQFVQLPDLPVGPKGLIRIELTRDTMITLTTTTGQRKGVAPSSLSARYQPFPFPYSDDFDASAVHKPARYLADGEGSFEVLPAADGTGNVLAQTTPFYPMLGCE
jgi:hypothetical protein